MFRSNLKSPREYFTIKFYIWHKILSTNATLMLVKSSAMQSTHVTPSCLIPTVFLIEALYDFFVWFIKMNSNVHDLYICKFLDNITIFETLKQERDNMELMWQDFPFKVSILCYMKVAVRSHSILKEIS